MPLTIGSLGEYISVCCRCGCALKETEISGSMKGIFEDFEKGIRYSETTIIYCRECKQATHKYANDSVRKAWLRMQTLEHP